MEKKKITDLVLRFYKGRHLICFLDQEACVEVRQREGSRGVGGQLR